MYCEVVLFGLNKLFVCDGMCFGFGDVECIVVL